MYNALVNESQVTILIKNFLEECKKEAGKPLLVLLGPTASGKTALSIKLAKEWNGEVISADSRQVYRNMDIGTDKIPEKKREGIAHHLMDIVDPNERFTVADFKKRAEEVIDDVHERGKLPILVGGTGLYIRSITHNFALPPQSLGIRMELMKELEQKGSDALHKKLEKFDPESAARIHPKNIPYVVRALEICMTTGRPKIDLKNEPRYVCLQIGVSSPREALFERINKRADEQIERGLLDEVKRLLAKGYSRDLQSMRSLGYREMIAHLDRKLSLFEAVELLKKNTRNFAKRQITWFKRDRDVVWMAPPDMC